MNQPPERPNHLREALQKQGVRRDIWRIHGERSFAKNLAMIGAIGWLVVAPILGGILIGRWLDRQLEKGITFTAAFLMAGAVLGGWLAWRRMNTE